MDLRLRRVELAFAAPLQTAYGELRSRELIEVTLTDEEGLEGRGEAAPLEPYDGVSVERTLEALEAYRRALADPPEGATLLDACRAADDLPQALAAIDMGLWDLAGRRARRPVCELLSSSPAASIAVNASIATTDPAAAATAAAAAVKEGYTCVKLKVGVGDDEARVAAVRSAIGAQTALRLDANGAWSVGQAVSILGVLADHALELVEEPVEGLEATRELRERVPVRIAIDETAAQAGALTARVADAVCLKISRCGGIGGLLAAASLVRSSGADIYLSSSYDGPLGIAAALHAAAALAPLPPCGLATLELFAQAPPASLRVSRGAIAVPSAAGLGV
ncbi:MAG TPA: mandelate racemase/muconate lactonizing enzyme family protein [Solirubrobacteraceae bacterium]|nr:mandelate racemase/muconate lactonizing enzyme family protein [Solirubrobacteraceae bacterium]